MADRSVHAFVGILTCPWFCGAVQNPFTTADHRTATASCPEATAPVLPVYVFAQRRVISSVLRGSAK